MATPIPGQAFTDEKCRLSETLTIQISNAVSLLSSSGQFDILPGRKEQNSLIKTESQT